VPLTALSITGPDAARQLAAIVNSSDDAIYSSRLDGELTTWNPGAERLFGYGVAEAIGRNASMLVPAPQAHELTEILRVLRTGGRVRSFETERRARDGRVLHVSLSISPIEDAAGTVVGATTIARDLGPERSRRAEIEALEAQLWQAQKMESLGRLASGVAHDFNNLLLAIRGYAELVEAEAEGPSAKRAHEIVKATEHAATLTRQLLTFSRQESIDPRPLDLNELVDETADMLHRLLDERVALVWRPAGEAAATRGDPTQLQQVLVNLVVNASDAMPAGGTVGISAEHVLVDEEFARTHVDASPGRHVVLSVSDTGTGIDADTVARIFDPFFTTKPPGLGTGLGLSTVYGIVRQHEGFVTVETRPAKGTTFRVHLPAL
jgi:PAS domain S-box-containing protein